MNVLAKGTSFKTTTILLIVCALAGTFIGGALLKRAPETKFTPEFSKVLVTMQDGHKLNVQNGRNVTAQDLAASTYRSLKETPTSPQRA